MTDKDFKQQNNYREVECCGNCKHEIYNGMNGCGLRKQIVPKEYMITYNIFVCDKWEHE